MDDSLLELAAKQGILTAEQREQLVALQQQSANQKQDEQIKTFSSFNEFFVTVGVVLLVMAVNGLIALLLPDSAANLIGAASFVLVAEYFYRKKRFSLPMLAMVFLCALHVADSSGEWVESFSHKGVSQMVAALAALPVLIAGALRYRIAVLMLPIALAFTLAVTYAADLINNTLGLQFLLGGCGLIILAVAIRLDMRDPQRTSRLSDFAFWGYVIGSPLFVHSLFLSVVLDKSIMIGVAGWLLIAAMAAMVSFLGVLLNRRALILSTMAYVGYLLVRLLSNTPLGMSSVLLVALCCIGLYIYALGARWAQTRSALIRKLPNWSWLRYLPPA